MQLTTGIQQVCGLIKMNIINVNVIVLLVSTINQVLQYCTTYY